MKLKAQKVLFSAVAGGAAMLAINTYADFPFPISVESESASIRLSVIGTYRGGIYSKNTPALPPGYDPQTKRLFIGSVDRKAVDVLDISNPSGPVKSFGIDLSPAEPNGLSVHKGLVAVSTKIRDSQPLYGEVRIFNADGKQVVDPITIRLPDADPVQAPSRIAFTPNGRQLVVTLAGAPNEDYTIDPDGAIAVIDLGPVNWGGCRKGQDKCHIQPTVRIADFQAYNDKKAELIASGVRIYGPNNPTVAQDVNPEGLTISQDLQLAWITLERNNAIAVVDLNQAKVIDLFPLGWKDHSKLNEQGKAVNGFDASDKDGGINIQAWPVRSFYSPDGIAVVGGGQQSFLLTANEGDPKDDAFYSEKVRLSEDSYRLDPNVFCPPPTCQYDAAVLKKKENLGRLQVTKASGDSDGDDDFDEIYMLGARSFSVWTTDGTLVFDSGDAFEQITAAAVPAFFNTSEDSNELDARSDDRGPEPEYLTVGKVGPREYVFIGFERISGVMVYDISNPRQPSFVQYINNRNFNFDPSEICGTKGEPQLPDCEKVGDLETEGLLFIAREDSPIHVPLLVVSHELSDSTTLYRIDPTDMKDKR